MRSFADHLKARWTRDECVVIFSHGSPIARLIDAWLTDTTGPSFRFIIDNAAISAVRHQDGLSSLICLNESSHLAGIAAPVGSSFNDDGIVKPHAPSSYW
jgi:broad specificity phosphatase PhoE